MLALLSNYRSLQCGLLCDDVLHFPYLYQVFHGHPDLLLRNFYSAWMDDDFLWKFYRPLTELSIATDYLFWQGTAVGYHITNLSLHVVCSVLVYLLTGKLARCFELRPASLFAFGAASLFAVYPLHIEVLSWVVARDEPLCEAFYFLSFLAFIDSYRSQHRRLRTVGLLAFAVALLCKETAVSLPAALALFCLVLNEGSWTRAKAALEQTAGYWLILAAYLVLRGLALGSVAGGYSGSFGDLLNSTIVSRWLSSDSFLRLLYPFNHFVFAENSLLKCMLQSCYVAIALVVMLRCRLGLLSQNQFRCIGFCAGWLLVSILPTAQVWGIHPNLMGGRLVYLGSVSLIFILALLLFSSRSDGEATDSKVRQRFISNCAGSLILCALVATFMVISSGNFQPWIYMTNEQASFRRAIEAELSSLPQEQTLLITEVPHNDRGAHSLYSHRMLTCIVRPPLSGKDLSSRISTLDSNWIIDPDPVDPRLLTRILGDRHFKCVYWDDDQHALMPVKWDARPEAPVTTAIQKVAGTEKPLRDNWYVTFQPEMPAPAVDSVRVWITARDCSSTASKLMSRLSPKPAVWLYWSTKKNDHFTQSRKMSRMLIADGRPHVYDFSVGESKAWLFADKIRALSFVLPHDDYECQVCAVHMIRNSQPSPTLSIVPTDFAERSGDGVYSMLGAQARLKYDASNVPGASYVQVEVAKRHSRFCDYSGKMRDTETCKKQLFGFDLPNLQGTFDVQSSWFAEPGWYQIRISARNPQDQVVGVMSESLSVGTPR